MNWRLWGSNPRPYGMAPEATALDHSAKPSSNTNRANINNVLWSALCIIFQLWHIASFLQPSVLDALTAVGFEPTPLRNGALSHSLRPLGQTVTSKRSGVNIQAAVSHALSPWRTDGCGVRADALTEWRPLLTERFQIAFVQYPLEAFWKHSGSLWKPSGSFLEAFWKPSGSLLEALWKHSGSLLEAFWKPSGSILEASGSFWKPSGSLWNHSGSLWKLLEALWKPLESFWKLSGSILEAFWKLPEASRSFQKLSGSLLEAFLKLLGAFWKLLEAFWKLSGSFLEAFWKLSGSFQKLPEASRSFLNALAVEATASRRERLWKQPFLDALALEAQPVFNWLCKIMRFITVKRWGASTLKHPKTNVIVVKLVLFTLCFCYMELKFVQIIRVFGTK